MIPDLVELNGSPWKVLPPGVHNSSLLEISHVYNYNHHRNSLFIGLMAASESLLRANVKYLYLDGSFVTEKPKPGDYDACWDPVNVEADLLDPVFLNFENLRQAQKEKYLGEFFPSSFDAGTDQDFINFFQVDKFTGLKKGILLIDLHSETFT